MKRKPNSLLPLEIEILLAAQEYQASGVSEFHGFALAKRMRERNGARMLTAYGTLYKGLSRLENMGLVQGWWEDAETAEREGRRRRRFYRLTGEAIRVLESLQDEVVNQAKLAPGLAGTSWPFS